MPTGVYKRTKPIWNKGIKIPANERFLKFFDISTKQNCWEWKGSRHKFGYGYFYDGKKITTGHRFSYLYYKGNIPKGLYVCHKCDNPSCVNPSHLFLGTIQDNLRDMYIKGRDVHVVGEKNGKSKLTVNIIKIIRKLNRSHKFSNRHIARMFGVGHSCINNIVNGKTWKKQRSKNKN